MKIGINLISLKDMTGIAVYSRELLYQFIKQDTPNEYIIFINEKMEEYFNFKSFANFSKFQIIKFRFNPKNFLKRLFYEQIIIPFYSQKFKIDIIFNPNIFTPVLTKKPIVVTIHDLIYLKEKQIIKKIYYTILTYFIRIRKIFIVTPSNFSKNEIINNLKIKANRIRVIYEGIPTLNGFSNDLQISLKIKDIIEKYKPYFFYIGRITSHKNIKNIIEAFQMFSSKNNNFYLVLAGPLDDENFKKFFKNEHILYLDKANEREKILLYKNSFCLTFPSLYEGFGLPVLEAQSLGVPVLTSNTSSLPEVAGEGALYVDPYNVEEIAKGMERIAFDENLRKDLIQKGYENIKRFSWEKAANELLNLFKSIC
jgi:glycosyltransferase involved in cell wall biosynthesis